MSAPLKQVAALPVMDTPDGTKVLLITTRGRGRWSIPKGWPKRGVADNEMAVIEAIEEAGVEGKISKKPIGKFAYNKRLQFYTWSKCVVDVYRLKVRTHHLTWREKGERQVKWASPQEAASLVSETELAALLRSVFRLKAA